MLCVRNLYTRVCNTWTPTKLKLIDGPGGGENTKHNILITLLINVKIKLKFSE